jgi:hypothetical protein
MDNRLRPKTLGLLVIEERSGLKVAVTRYDVIKLDRQRIWTLRFGNEEANWD